MCVPEPPQRPRPRRPRRCRGSILAIAAATALAVGCGDPGAAVMPETGWWSYVNGGILQNSCGRDDVYTDPDLTFWLTGSFGDTFTIAQGQQEDFTCTISGTSFFCPQRLSGITPVSGYDAELHYRVSITGTLPSARSMAGTQRFEVTCQGSECGLAPLAGWTLPCAYEVAFTGAKQ